MPMSSFGGLCGPLLFGRPPRLLRDLPPLLLLLLLLLRRRLRRLWLLPPLLPFLPPLDERSPFADESFWRGSSTVSSDTGLFCSKGARHAQNGKEIESSWNHDDRSGHRHERRWPGRNQTC